MQALLCTTTACMLPPETEKMRFTDVTINVGADWYHLMIPN